MTSARDILAEALQEVSDSCQSWHQDADAILKALADAGFSVVRNPTEEDAADLLRALVTAARNGKPLAPVVIESGEGQ